MVGGGAAGVFSAIAAARLGAQVTILEATSKPLRKVSLSACMRELISSTDATIYNSELIPTTPCRYWLAVEADVTSW